MSGLDGFKPIASTISYPVQCSTNGANEPITRSESDPEPASRPSDPLLEESYFYIFILLLVMIEKIYQNSV